MDSAPELDASTHRGAAGQPAWARTALLTLVGIAACALPLLATRHSEFLCDDMDALSRLRHEGLARALWDPVNIQVVPLHRLFMWLVDVSFGVDHTAAVVALLVLHALGLWLLYRVLTRLVRLCAPGPGASELLPAALLLTYATYPLLQVQFLWYSAGLHRLPYAAASFWTMACWLAYRQTSQRRQLALIGLGVVIASGFYGKGPVLVPQLAALELALWPWTERDRRIPHLKALGALCLGALGLAALNLLFASDRPVNPSPNVLTFLATLPKVFALFVGALGGELRALGPLARPSTLSLTVGIQVVVAAMAFSFASGRRYRPAWGVMLLGLIGHVAVVALSNRSAHGLLVFNLLAHRYYLEPLVLLVPLAGIALAGVQVPVPWQRTWSFVVVVAVGGLGVGHLLALQQSLSKGPLYGQFRSTHAFYETLALETRRVIETLPTTQRTVLDERLPPRVACFAPHYTHVSTLFDMRAVPLTADRTGTLLLEDDGSLSVRGPEYDPDRHIKLRQRRRTALQKMMEASKRRAKAK